MDGSYGGGGSKRPRDDDPYAPPAYNPYNNYAPPAPSQYSPTRTPHDPYPPPPQGGSGYGGGGYGGGRDDSYAPPPVSGRDQYYPPRSPPRASYRDDYGPPPSPRARYGPPPERYRSRSNDRRDGGGYDQRGDERPSSRGPGGRGGYDNRGRGGRGGGGYRDDSRRYDRGGGREYRDGAAYDRDDDGRGEGGRSFSPQPSRQSRFSDAPRHKRPAVDYADGRGPQDPATKQYNTTILVPSTAMGMLIGKGGSTRQEIVNESGCKIRIQEHADVPDGGTERAMTLAGSWERVSKAITIVLDKLESRRRANAAPPAPPAPPANATQGGFTYEPMKQEDPQTEPDPRQPYRWLIPVDAVGLLIGKRGAGLQSIMEQTGARIRVANEEEMPPGSKDRIVTVTGRREERESATRLIQQRVGGRPLDPPTHVKIPVKCIGYILGTKGATIRELRDASKARVQVAELSEVEFGLGQVRVDLDGSPQQVETAKALVLDKVQKWYGMHPDNAAAANDVAVKFAVPRALVGHLIGKGGAIVKEFAKDNVLVKILQDDRPHSRQTDDRPVLLVGPMDAVLDVHRKLLDHLAAAPPQLYHTAPPQRHAGPPKDNYGPDPRGSPPSSAYDPYGGPPGPPPPQGSQYPPSSGYGPPPPGPPPPQQQSAYDPYAPSVTPATEQQPYTSSQYYPPSTQDGAYQPPQDHQGGSSASYSYQPPSSSSASYAPPGSYQPPPSSAYGQPPTPQQAPSASASAPQQQQQPSYHADAHAYTTQQQPASYSQQPQHQQPSAAYSPYPQQQSTSSSSHAYAPPSSYSNPAPSSSSSSYNTQPSAYNNNSHTSQVTQQASGSGSSVYGTTNTQSQGPAQTQTSSPSKAAAAASALNPQFASLLSALAALPASAAGASSISSLLGPALLGTLKQPQQPSDGAGSAATAQQAQASSTSSSSPQQQSYTTPSGAYYAPPQSTHTPYTHTHQPPSSSSSSSYNYPQQQQQQQQQQPHGNGGVAGAGGYGQYGSQSSSNTRPGSYNPPQQYNYR